MVTVSLICRDNQRTHINPPTSRKMYLWGGRIFAFSTQEARAFVCMYVRPWEQLDYWYTQYIQWIPCLSDCTAKIFFIYTPCLFRCIMLILVLYIGDLCWNKVITISGSNTFEYFMSIVKYYSYLNWLSYFKIFILYELKYKSKKCRRGHNRHT